MNNELIKKAEAGDLDAIISLGLAYYNQEDGEENRGKAFEWYTKALELDPDNAKVINNLGNCYNNGVGVEKDTDKAMDFYRKAAELGFSNAQYNLADSLNNKKDPECLEWYQKAYENGDIDAPFNIAMIYTEGEIVPQDNQKYIEYLIKADEIGNDSATLNLACAYLEGECIEADKKKGLELMEKAANAGNRIAANNMSLAYKKGDGVEVDIEKSIEWAKKAAELGTDDSVFQYAIAYFNGNNLVEEDKAKAVDFFVISANTGSVTAMENLGVCYNNGYGVDLDKNKAVEWFEKAAKEGESKKALDNLEDLYPELFPNDGKKRFVEFLKSATEYSCEAMIKLYFLYSHGDYIPKDSEMARKYLEMAAEREYPSALYIKGCCYNGGHEGYENDLTKAFEYWKRAAEKDNVLALCNVGVSYRDGNPIEKDLDKAIEAFEKARSLGHPDGCVKLGYLYDSEGEAGTDYEKAFSYYKEAYEMGSETGAYCLGKLYENGKGVEKDLLKALELYEFAANNGHMMGAVNAGAFYCDGIGVEPDMSKAEEYFLMAKGYGFEGADELLSIVYNVVNNTDADPKRSFEFNLAKAENGDTDAQINLYEAYNKGIGVEANEEIANSWLKKAAEAGDPRAQAARGYDELVEGNTKKAIEYWENAVKNGNAVIMKDLADIYKTGANDLEPNVPRAIELYNASADAGFSEAMVSLGICYANGEGVEKDHSKMAELFKKAADLGNSNGQLNIGICYRNGDGVNTDKQLAFSYFEKSAAQGNIQAKANMYEMLKEGEGINVDLQKAETLIKEVIDSKREPYASGAKYDLAIFYITKKTDYDNAFPILKELSESGNPSAMYGLSLSYILGNGTPVNESEGYKWLERSANAGYEPAKQKLAQLNESQQYNNVSNSSSYSNTPEKKKGCYVATAVYGSYDCPEVWTLRRFRDNRLALTWYGRLFIMLYYSISPTIVKLFGKTRWFNTIVKHRLDSFVSRLQSEGYNDSPYYD